MRFARTLLSLSVVILAVAAVGCGESAEEPTLGSMVNEAADEAAEAATDGAAEVQEAAESNMDDAAEMADKIRNELAAKEAELAKVSEQIEQLSPQDLLTDNGKNLKAMAESLTAEIQELKGKL